MEEVYSDFDSLDDLLEHFDEKDSDGHEVLIALYDMSYYGGDAFILTKKDGQLYEVNAGHCSCHGLEGQWYPEETSKEELLFRIKKGKNSLLSSPFNKEMLLKALSKVD